MPSPETASELRELQGGTVFQTVLDSLQDAVCIMDKERRVLFWNDKAEKITGYLRQEVVGRPCNRSSMVQCDETNCNLCSGSCPLLETMHEGRAKESRLFLRHKLGHRVLVHMRTVPIRDERGHVIGAAQNFEELGLQRGNGSLQMYDCLDTVTGVPNQKYIRSLLQGNLFVFEECRVPFVVLCVELPDLDSFEGSWGREAGELILHVVAETLSRFLAARAVLGRWDEKSFLVVMPPGQECDVRAECEAIQGIAKKSTIRWWNEWLSINASVTGVTVRGGDTVDSLLGRLLPARANDSPEKQPPATPVAKGGERRES